ncbi:MULTISPECIES: hypothetical protein [Methanosarcina]|jgi:hypothetical protein|uniref:Uncharacterized protein n=2 Tax=Methanosarcina TaxID=2207 RepID=A0A2A2HMS1_9EURY|nr:MULTISPECIES: hypothetical protein [Methanosarcina]MDW5561507.1 hypothetical protein [Methanosarcina sp.]PAV10717.1 hypothetical protein ASJ81_12495 [Methanosarcina spelaei]
MASKLLKFTKVLKNGTTFYRFEGFENVDSRWELPCEYLSGSHFAAWNGSILYSNGNSIKTLCPGNLVSLSEYQELMRIIQVGKQRLKEIKRKMDT